MALLALPAPHEGTRAWRRLLEGPQNAAANPVGTLGARPRTATVRAESVSSCKSFRAQAALP